MMVKVHLLGFAKISSFLGVARNTRDFFGVACHTRNFLGYRANVGTEPM